VQPELRTKAISPKPNSSVSVIAAELLKLSQDFLRYTLAVTELLCWPAVLGLPQFLYILICLLKVQEEVLFESRIKPLFSYIQHV